MVNKSSPHTSALIVSKQRGVVGDFDGSSYAVNLDRGGRISLLPSDFYFGPIHDQMAVELGLENTSAGYVWKAFMPGDIRLANVEQLATD